MSWFNIGDEDHKDTGFRRGGLSTAGLFAMAGSYCMENLTDGRVPGWFVKSWRGGAQAAAQLVSEKKWAKVDGGDFQFIEWKEALTRAYVEKQRKKWREDKQNSKVESTVESTLDPTADSEVDRLVVLPTPNVQPPIANGSHRSRPGVVTNRGTSPPRAREVHDEPPWPETDDELCTNCDLRPDAGDNGWPGWCEVCISAEGERLQPKADALMWEMYDQ